MAASKALKKIYWLCLALIVFIAGVFFYLWQKESGEKKLLKEKGVKAEAWVLRLTEQSAQKRGGKKTVYQHFMDVAFFADTVAAKKVAMDTAVSQAKNGDDLVEKLFNKMESERRPMGDYTTIHIPISPGAYNKYNEGDKVKIIFLKEDITVARLQQELE